MGGVAGRDAVGSAGWGGIPGVGGEGGTDVAPEILSITSVVQEFVGAPATLSVSATGTRLRYRWESKKENETEWQLVPRRNRSTLTIETPPVDMFCTQYRAIVSNGAGSAESPVARVVPIRSRLVIKQALPASVTAKAGSTVQLTVSLDPVPGLFKWYVNDADPTWSADSTYAVGPLTLADDGMRVRVEGIAYGGNHMCGLSGVAESATVIRVVP
jgi:hypothetical protein